MTAPEAMTYADIVAALSTELGRDIEHVQVGLDDAREGMLDTGMPEDFVDGLIGLLEWFDTGSGVKVYSTVEDLTGSLGRSIETFVADYAGEFGA